MASNQLSLHTKRFSFQPVMTDTAAHHVVYEEMEVLIHERFTRIHAGGVFIEDPDKQWELIEVDEILRTHPMEWALARLLFLFHQSQLALDFAKVLFVEGKEARLPFIVRDHSGQLISQMTLAGKRLVERAGQAPRFKRLYRRLANPDGASPRFSTGC